MSKTENQRIYAIGDIHGCIDDLTDMQARIVADLKANPHPSPLIVYLGDYIDRGPDSRAVIENLMAADTASLPSRFLFGNHDAYIELFLDDPEDLRGRKFHWMDTAMGGAATLASYGVVEQNPLAAHAAFSNAIPVSHRNFLRGCDRFLRIGGYYFVHAGIDPAKTLDDQIEYDQIWMREPFLSSTVDFGAVVVHGHSPVREVENHGNRIAVDTGAVFGRHLSCLVLEDENQMLLTSAGRDPCLVCHGATPA